MKGEDPMWVPFSVKWPRLSATDEAIASLAEMQRSQGDQVYLQEGIISRNFVQQTRFGFDDDAIFEMEKEIAADEARRQAQVEAAANLQVSVKNAQVKAVAKGSNNGRDTQKADPGPAATSAPPHDPPPDK